MVKRIINYVMAVVGAIMALLGILWLRVADVSTYPLAIYGMGTGLFILGIIGIISNWYGRKNPEYKRLKDIESNDERNKFIHYKTGFKMYKITVIILSVIMLATIILGAPAWIKISLWVLVMGDCILYQLIFKKSYKLQ